MDDEYVFVNLEEDLFWQSTQVADLSASKSDDEESFEMISNEHESVASDITDQDQECVTRFNMCMKMEDIDIKDVVNEHACMKMEDADDKDVVKEHARTKMEDVDIKDVVKAHALKFLPAKSLSKFRVVSKEWDQWISSPFFAHQHTVYHKDVGGLFCQLPGENPFFISIDAAAFGVSSADLSFLPEPVCIRTTCNGLLCCQGCNGNRAYYICNPVTKVWRMLPEPNLYHDPGTTGVALAFNPTTYNFAANYELICVVPLPDVPDLTVLHFEIYSSRTNTWRISETLFCETEAVRVNGDGFCTGDYAYWETQTGVILAFNVDDQQYGIINLPPGHGPTGALTDMHGHLCYLLPQKYDEYAIEVYGTMKMSLERVIPISPNAVQGLNGLLRAVCLVNDDIVILELGGKVIAYNVRTEMAKWLSDARNEGFTKYLPYVNNLVTVANLVDGEVD